MTLKRSCGIMEESWTEEEETQISALPYAACLSLCPTSISIKKKSHSFPTTSSSASPINAGVLVSLRILNYILLFSLLTVLMDDLLTSYNYFYMLETLQSESPAKIIFHPTTQWISHMQFNAAKAEPIISLLSQTCFSYYP